MIATLLLLLVAPRVYAPAPAPPQALPPIPAPPAPSHEPGITVIYSPYPASIFPPVEPPPGGQVALSIDPGSWVTPDDYPADAWRARIEGRVFYRVRVRSSGRADRCVIGRSSGSRSLDERTCKILVGRARFQPARNARGRAVEGAYNGIVRWQMPSG